jgi:hypothetical protein
MRSGTPLCSERASFWANSLSISNSSTPRLVMASASCTLSDKGNALEGAGGIVEVVVMIF